MSSTSQFSVDVDELHRAKRLRYFSLQRPHARAFHAAYAAFFAANFAVFAVPSLVVSIRDDLDLTDTDITNAAIASLAGTVAARLVMGTVAELLGPRLGSASVLLCCSSATFGMALAGNATDFIVLRLLMGFAMACFVHCQYWTSVMYSPPVVGFANGLAAGIANSGAGIVHLYCIAILAAAARLDDFLTWRVVLLPAGALQIAVAAGVLAFAQDCPDGDYRVLRERGAMQRPPMAAAIREAAMAWRVWALALVYAATFGVELTINNFIQQYFQDQFSLSTTIAGVLSSLFGIWNIAARPLGGVLSDVAAGRQGLPGRVRVVFLLSALAGGACMALKAASSSLGATVAALIGTAAAGMGANGAVWGVVPFLGSKGALGVVAGVVGAAGPIGALILSSAIMKTQASKADGFFYIGLVELCASPVVLAIVLRWGQRRQRESELELKQHAEDLEKAQQAQQAQQQGGTIEQQGSVGGKGGLEVKGEAVLSAAVGAPCTPRHRAHVTSTVLSGA